MPNYDYKCAKCGAIDEKLVNFDDRDKKWKHDDCGGNMVRGIYTPPILIGFDKSGSSGNKSGWGDGMPA